MLLTHRQKMTRSTGLERNFPYAVLKGIHPSHRLAVYITREIADLGLIRGEFWRSLAVFFTPWAARMGKYFEQLSQSRVKYFAR